MPRGDLKPLRHPKATVSADSKLRQNFPHHTAMYVGQAAVPALKTVGQTQMVEAQEVQQSGVQVVYLSGIAGDVETQFVGLSVDMGGLHSAA